MQSPSMARLTRSVLALAVIALSFTACKDDDNGATPDGGDNNPAKAFIPAKDKTYRYKTTDSDGTSTSSVTKVTGTKDSSGIEVFAIRDVLTDEEGDFAIDYKAYSHSGLTTNELSYPASLIALVNQIGQEAYIEDLSISGFPQIQSLENKGTVGSALTFKGDPINMNMKLLFETGDGTFAATMQVKVTYASGKATNQEKITVPGGAYDCTKWEYTYEVYSRVDTEIVSLEEKTLQYKVALWTAPGVGVVKVIETSEEGTSTTELQKVD